jgi:hypothetical protein
MSYTAYILSVGRGRNKPLEGLGKQRPDVYMSRWSLQPNISVEPNIGLATFALWFPELLSKIFAVTVVANFWAK